ncbi:MAG: thioredoxin-disulfide reductase [Acidobacteriota bacterium]|nr:thioredoxin-disulfide reductase [Acidobacteriota bacterium]MDE3030672.1 thioredoxin-disulfide reductase [Acidobacteriota bacterium]MDE3093334.1 thioredoxin-disulfide reductase [Acidobacteriota bacterium]MDE3138753.1 thioredoxin-disulfide reductase [Acidobacteriota bacterium]MDE3146693.1 thioredoxin-disulfide reductase [Acidobacteriota bacterium]
MTHTRVLIIGSGPAGLTAAIYTGRAQLKPLVIEGEPSSTTDQPGGQLMLTTDIENFPGFPEALTGPELMARMREQAERFGAELRVTKVQRLDVTSRPFRAWLTDDDEPSVSADAVILATGAQSLMMGVPGEERLLSHGLSTCATCDGFFFRGHDIAVVGGGDSAIEEALFLTRFASSVTIVHRRDSLRASKIMQERAFANEKIRFAWNSQVQEVLGDDRVSGLRVRDTVSGDVRDLDVTGVFVAIGHVPNTVLVKDQADLHDNGYVRTHVGSYTSIDGLFAAGDVQDHVYRQAITSAGSGCIAAIDAERWLESQGL